MKKIPTNIITGFLGVGKTTTILNLLSNKPDNEVWAVLVNEFGEVGVDGALMKEQGAVVREVPGGCMCCVAGLPMQIGLNMLIAKAKPDRLLIEPTGLGHPKQIIDTLTNDYYADLLDLQATITLVDPRNLSLPRYLENENFRDQLALADVVIANKVDQCSEQDKTIFDAKMAEYHPPKKITGWVSQGAMDADWLTLPRASMEAITIPETHQAARHSHTSHSTDSNNELPAATLQLKAGERFVRKENTGQGYFSAGWLFSEAAVLNYDQLYSYFSGLDTDRLKAVVKTDKGVYGFNALNGVLTITPLQEAIDSRIEFIHSKKLNWDEIEQVLLAALGSEPVES